MPGAAQDPAGWSAGKQPPDTAEPLTFRSLDEEGAPDSAALEIQSREEAAEQQAQAALEASLHAAMERGRREATEEAERTLLAAVASERATVSRMVKQFEEEKQRYFSDVEREVVKLSLAIAERVLHREAEMDPTLLAGAARVALEQVADTSGTVLRVSPQEMEQWSESMGPFAAKGITVQADGELPKGECVLKTQSGTVQLGLRAQLQEIERGFFELLQRRPALAL